MRIIATDKAPAAIGPYSQATVHGDTVYCSGQVALAPGKTGLQGTDAASQARQVLTNLGHVLEAAGSGLDKALKCTVYLVDMADYPAVNSIYGEFFGGHAPARAAFAVAALPLGALVEIDCIAAIG